MNYEFVPRCSLQYVPINMCFKVHRYSLEILQSSIICSLLAGYHVVEQLVEVLVEVGLAVSLFSLQFRVSQFNLGSCSLVVVNL